MYCGALQGVIAEVYSDIQKDVGRTFPGSSRNVLCVTKHQILILAACCCTRYLCGYLWRVLHSHNQ